jgi:crotonobetainyl-CoA:carnitine CoA-transferase CaiB-like acyl-CoA transferase
MYEAVAALLTFSASIYFATGNAPRRRGNEHATIVPYETFEAPMAESTSASRENATRRRRHERMAERPRQWKDAWQRLAETRNPDLDTHGTIEARKGFDTRRT